MAMRPLQFALLRLGDLDNRYQGEIEGGGFGSARSREKDPLYPEGLERILG